MSSRELLKRLADDGWFEVATRGSHVQLKHPTKPGRVTVPHPKKDLPLGTVRSVLKQAQLI
jgi:predicted RNA binding protein YcfA (HicA-like mRNA interferase family)